MAEGKTHTQSVALITGGAGGIGRATAARLIERGITCLLVDIDEEALNRASRALGPQALTHRADLRDPQAIAALVERVNHAFGHLDVLINNVGVTNTLPFEQRNVDSIFNELQINLLSPIALTHALLPSLQAARDGRVISTVSLGGLFPLPETTVYSASKFGLRGAMLCLGLDAERLGVKFSIVNPSATETPMLIREALTGGNKLQFMDPPQTADEVAHCIVRSLDAPKLERYVRNGESWLVRLSMLLPNQLVRLIPLFRRSAEKGHQRYIASLQQRGLIERHEGQWRLRADIH
ncbi:MAG TPA: SDR family oxidoreductase [Hydrogenophaga sp.]